MKRLYFKRIFAIALIAATILMLISGCSNNEPKLDPNNPVTITIWHYYNGAILNAFEESIKEFNETIGLEKGIIVENSGYGSVPELEKAIRSSVNQEIGSLEMPNIFASYSDVAYETEQKGMLVNLNNYITKNEQDAYYKSFIEEGKFGSNDELKIVPIAKSTELLTVNETDWLRFANDNNLTYDDIKTMEGLARVSEIYYEWSGGKAFFGRDGMANFFIQASKQFGIEIFEVRNGDGVINVDREVMRKIWDYYYIPYISGYFGAYGRFRSDDAKVGDILAYVSSTASALYFPQEVIVNDSTYPISAKILPSPIFEGGSRVMIQQGAGMSVTKSTPEKEYASVLFLKWFTEIQKNIEFSAISGYMPVKKEALDYDLYKTQIEASGIKLEAITEETLKVSLEEIKTSELYTNKAFEGGIAARAIIESDLQDKANADREAVVNLINSGSTHEEAVAQFKTEDNFNNWVDSLIAKLNDVLPGNGG